MLRDPMLRFLVTHLFQGTTAALVVGAVLLYGDIGGLATVIGKSGDKGLALFLLFFGLWITFGSIAMGVAIMRLGRARATRDE